MKQTTMKFNNDELNDIIEMLDWALSDYPDPEEEEYKEYVRIARRFESAKARINGQKYNKKNSYFG